MKDSSELLGAGDEMGGESLGDVFGDNKDIVAVMDETEGAARKAGGHNDQLAGPKPTDATRHRTRSCDRLLAVDSVTITSDCGHNTSPSVP